MKSKKLISLILFGISTLSIIRPVTVNAVTDTTVEQVEQVELDDIPSVTELATEFSSDTQDVMNKTDKLLQTAENDPTQENIETVINSFTSMYITLQDIQAYEVNKENNECDKLFERIVVVIKRLPDNIRNIEFIDFSKKLSQNYNVTFQEGYNSFFKGYVAELNTLDIPEIKSDLNGSWLYVSNRSSDSMKENADGLDAQTGIDREAMNKAEIANEAPTEVIEPAISSSVSYEKKDGKVYKITKYIDENGILINMTSEIAPKEDWILAGVTTYADFGGGTSSIPSRVSTNQWNYINENQNPESNLTVQYCINKDSDSPYYYDTGIRASLDGKISYEQLRDVLYQVSVKSGGWFTEDTDKLLAVIEGKPVLAKNTKKVYTMEDMNLLFSSFKKVDVKILETRIGKSQNIEDSAISTDAKNIKVDDKDIQLVTTPLIKDARVLLPVEQLATEMGATVKTQDNKYIITRSLAIWRTVKGERKIVGHVRDTIVYEMNKNYVIVNGQMIQMGTSPDMKDGNFMAEVQEMAKALDYKLTWDTETGTLIFKS